MPLFAICQSCFADQSDACSGAMPHNARRSLRDAAHAMRHRIPIYHVRTMVAGQSHYTVLSQVCTQQLKATLGELFQAEAVAQSNQESSTWQPLRRQQRPCRTDACGPTQLQRKKTEFRRMPLNCEPNRSQDLMPRLNMCFARGPCGHQRSRRFERWRPTCTSVRPPTRGKGVEGRQQV